MEANATPTRPSQPWLVAFYFTVLSLASASTYFLYAFSRLMESSIVLAFANRPMPALTMLFIDCRIGVLLLPAPWFAFAVYSVARRAPSTHALIFFSASLILALGTLCVVLAVGFSLPWLPADIRIYGVRP